MGKSLSLFEITSLPKIRPLLCWMKRWFFPHGNLFISLCVHPRQWFMTLLLYLPYLFPNKTGIWRRLWNPFLNHSLRWGSWGSKKKKAKWLAQGRGNDRFKILCQWKHPIQSQSWLTNILLRGKKHVLNECNYEFTSTKFKTRQNSPIEPRGACTGDKTTKKKKNRRHKGQEREEGEWYNTGLQQLLRDRQGFIGSTGW